MSANPYEATDVEERKKPSKIPLAALLIVAFAVLICVVGVGYVALSRQKTKAVAAEAEAREILKRLKDESVEPAP